jgi:hypothetical protein
VSGASLPERVARAALSFLAEPGDPAPGPLLRCCEPAEIVAALSSGDDPGTVLPAAGRDTADVGTGWLARRWRSAAASSVARAVLEDCWSARSRSWSAI